MTEHENRETGGDGDVLLAIDQERDGVRPHRSPGLKIPERLSVPCVEGKKFPSLLPPKTIPPAVEVNELGPSF